jgi:hypothetical protein
MKCNSSGSSRSISGSPSPIGGRPSSPGDTTPPGEVKRYGDGDDAALSLPLPRGKPYSNTVDVVAAKRWEIVPMLEEEDSTMFVCVSVYLLGICMFV